jgi:hypothetical membrane protein
LRLAGTLILIAPIQFIIGVVIAESVYPGYSVNQNYLSDLGATVRSTDGGVSIIIQQPASAIFTTILIVAGALLLAAVYLMFATAKLRRPVVFIGLFGLGVLGAGIFSEVFYPTHGIFSLIAFLFGALAAIDAFRLEKRPMSYISPILGVISLVALFLFLGIAGYGLPTVYTPLGLGGMERMIVYPTFLWLVAFGASVIASPELVAKPA